MPVMYTYVVSKPLMLQKIFILNCWDVSYPVAPNQFVQSSIPEWVKFPLNYTESQVSEPQYFQKGSSSEAHVCCVHIRLIVCSLCASMRLEIVCFSFIFIAFALDAPNPVAPGAKLKGHIHPSIEYIWQEKRGEISSKWYFHGQP